MGHRAPGGLVLILALAAPARPQQGGEDPGTAASRELEAVTQELRAQFADMDDDERRLIALHLKAMRAAGLIT